MRASGERGGCGYVEGRIGAGGAIVEGAVKCFFFSMGW